MRAPVCVSGASVVGNRRRRRILIGRQSGVRLSVDSSHPGLRLLFRSISLVLWEEPLRREKEDGVGDDGANSIRIQSKAAADHWHSARWPLPLDAPFVRSDAKAYV